MFKLVQPSVLEGKILYSVHKKDNELHLLTADGYQYKFCHFKGCCQQAVLAISGVLGKEIISVRATKDTRKPIFVHEDFQDKMPSDEQWIFCSIFISNNKKNVHFMLLGDGNGDNDGFPCFMELTDQPANIGVSQSES